MARLVAAFGTSHSVMLAAELADWISGFRDSDRRMPYYDDEGRPLRYDELLARAPSDAAERSSAEALARAWDRTQVAMRRLKERIARAALDALIVVGDDQYELFHDEHMPAIGIYYGDTIRNAARHSARRRPAPEAWYERAMLRRLEDEEDAYYPCHRALGLHLIEGLIEREFDVSAVARLGKDRYEGHAYSFIHRYYLQGVRLPIVPIFLNTYNAPNPPLPRRCVRLGAALKAIVESYPGEERIGLLASGGLSHFRVEEDLDRAVIEAMRSRDLESLAELDPRRLKAGSSEIRSWIAVAAAATGLLLEWIEYIPVYRTPALTGIGLAFAHWG